MLNIGTIKLPVNAATKTFAVLAKRGAGKSYTGAVMAEEFSKNNIPFIVFDPIDVWWGLRLAANGKDKGLPVVVFGLEHADLLLDREMGRKIAQAVVRENVSCVISTFGMPKIGQRHLMAELAEELLNINNSPRHIFIEEAHEFVPQRVFGGIGKTFNAVSNLVVMGRNRGLGVTMINQRAATINKDVLTQIDTLLAFRNIAPQDRKALKEWVEFHSAQGDFDKFMDSLPSLPTGEGWVWSPEFLGVFEKVKIRKRETFHPDREKLGDKFEMPHLDQIDVQSFIQKFSLEIKEKPKGKKTDIVLPETHPIKSVKSELEWESELRNLRNEYESKLIAKDAKIRQLEGTLSNVSRLVGGNGLADAPSLSLGISPTVQMWLDKLGTGGKAKMFKFLAEKAGMKFTRSQLAVQVGLSGESVRIYMPTLKQNNLVIEEGGFVKINPEL